MPEDRTLANLRRRLEKAELDHLRQHAAELAERLEHAEADAARAWEVAEGWRENAMSLMDQIIGDDPEAAPGLTKDGDLVVVRHDTSRAAS